MRKNLLRVSIIFCGAIFLVFAFGLWVQYVQAGTPYVGCPGGSLTVQTGQSFYVTVAISDVLDLYAWQTDVTYNTTYLQYEKIVFSNFLEHSGASQYVVEPRQTSGRLEDIAVTRLSLHTGENGSGNLAYLFFTALKDTGTGLASARLVNTILVDRNALEIDRNIINSGNCWVDISDAAPILVQLPVGYVFYVPTLLR
jgi:hypothetical protein